MDEKGAVYSSRRFGSQKSSSRRGRLHPLSKHNNNNVNSSSSQQQRRRRRLAMRELHRSTGAATLSTLTIMWIVRCVFTYMHTIPNIRSGFHSREFRGILDLMLHSY
jgi:hypothetical protein